MAALTVTDTSVVDVAATKIGGTIGETITAGMSVYLKTDGKWWKAQCDGTAAEAGSGGVGIAMNGGAANQPLIVATGGTINIGATTAKVHYFVHGTAGGIGVAADVGSGNYITRLGYATATDGSFTIDIRVTGITV